MPRRRVAFTQAEVARAVAGARAAGLEVAGVRIEVAGEGAAIVVLTSGAAPAETDPVDDWFKAQRCGSG